MGADPKDKMEPHLWGTEGDPGGLERAKREDGRLLRCARPHGSCIVPMSQLACQLWHIGQMTSSRHNNENDSGSHGRTMHFKVLEPSPHSSLICKIRPVKSAIPPWEDSESEGMGGCVAAAS